MRILNLEEFPDELCQVKFSFEEGCKQVDSQILAKETAKDPKTEKEIEFPLFSLVMWNHILTFQKILTHREFNSKYFAKHRDFINGLKLGEYLEKCLLGRMYRTYGSLVRDCLFSLELKETLSQFGVEVRFNRVLDTEGIDVLLLYKGNRYGLNLFLDSPNAHRQRKDKEENRHEEYGDVIMIDLPCPMLGRWQNGDIWMYGITDKNIVRKELGLPLIEVCSFVNDIL